MQRISTGRSQDFDANAWSSRSELNFGLPILPNKLRVGPTSNEVDQSTDVIDRDRDIYIVDLMIKIDI